MSLFNRKCQKNAPDLDSNAYYFKIKNGLFSDVIP